MANKIFGNLIICPFKASIQHNFISGLFLTLHQTMSKCELARPHCTASINSSINTDYFILQNINLNKRVDLEILLSTTVISGPGGPGGQAVSKYHQDVTAEQLLLT